MTPLSGSLQQLEVGMPSVRSTGTVVLIRPARIVSSTAINTNTPAPPLGLAYLAGALLQAGYTPVAIDACGLAPDQYVPINDAPGFLGNGLTAEELVERVPADAILIGVSCMFSREWVSYRRVLDALSKRWPGIPIVVGGEHATAAPELVLEACPGASACALGEGEETIVEVARAVSTGASLRGVAGLVIRESDRTMIRTEPRRRIRQIDEIPRPYWDGLPITTYLDRRFGMDETLHRAMPMLASRGCPYRCTFCSSPSMWGTTWLARGTDDVLDEIRGYVRRYGINHVEFYDLTTIVDRRWILEFTRKLTDAQLGITWTMPSGTRSEALDSEVLTALRASGCRGLTYAPESGSPATLARIKKKVDPERMLLSIRSAVHAGLYVKVHLIVGLPGQTARELGESFRFSLKLALAGVHDLLVYPFNPYPGSELYNSLVASKRIPTGGPAFERFLLGADYGDTRGVGEWSEFFSRTAVTRIAAVTMLVFYSLQFALRPLRLVRVILRILSAKPRTWFERALSAQRRSWRFRVLAQTGR